MQKVTVPRGDKGFNLSFTVKDASSSAYSLSGYTVKLKAWTPGSTSSLAVNASCSVDSSAAGTCHYVVQSGDFDSVIRYHAELELTKASVAESTQPFTITVTESG